MRIGSIVSLLVAERKLRVRAAVLPRPGPRQGGAEPRLALSEADSGAWASASRGKGLTSLERTVDVDAATDLVQEAQPRSALTAAYWTPTSKFYQI